MTNQPDPRLIIAAQQQQLADAQLAAAVNLARAQQAETDRDQARARVTELEAAQAPAEPA